MKKWVFSTVALSLSILLSMFWVATAAADRGSRGDWEKEVIERTVELGAGGALVIESINGSITIKAWDRTQVGITAQKKVRSKNGNAAELLQQIEVDIRETAGRVAIETLVPGRESWNRGVHYKVDYEIMVPRDIAVDVHSANGGVSAEGVGGEVSLHTVNGGIEAVDIGGDLEASTTNGGIRARRIGGRVDASSTNGSISAEMLANSLSEDIELSTTNGSIELAVDASLAASIEARTQNGTIDGDLVERPANHKRHHSRHKRVSFDLNGGGPLISLRATNGRIHLDRI